MTQKTHREYLPNGSYYMSDKNAYNVMVSAQLLYDYIEEIHTPIVDYYNQYPHKAIDRSTWEPQEIIITNLYQDILKLKIQSRIAWRKTRTLIEW